MDSILRLPSNNWLLESDLAPHVDAYVDYLKLGQYANTTIKRYVGCIAHFAHWTGQCGLELHRVDEEAVGRILCEHLPHCDCPSPLCRRVDDLRPACRHLLHVIRDKAVIAEYLRFERPPSANRAVFVRHIAPRDVPIGPDAVRRVIRDAYRRIGLTHGRTPSPGL